MPRAAGADHFQAHVAPIHGQARHPSLVAIDVHHLNGRGLAEREIGERAPADVSERLASLGRIHAVEADFDLLPAVEDHQRVAVEHGDNLAGEPGLNQARDFRARENQHGRHHDAEAKESP
ncbi:MAG: hypothetical protein MUE61_12745, partial [Vicinamibacterales bacterium]|nr:hypothetical protein [Vicinamibacterales bacterium]